jgi:integrase/recombinase XerD
MTPRRPRSSADLPLRNSSPKTRPLAVACVSRFARSVHRSPALLGPEPRRASQLERVHEQKRSWRRFPQTVCARRCLDRVTLGQDWRLTHRPCPRAETPLPIVRSPPAVAPVFAAIPPLTDRTVLMTAYAAGWRSSEALHGPMAAIAAQRLVSRVRQGQGHQDRSSRRSPTRLAR